MTINKLLQGKAILKSVEIRSSLSSDSIVTFVVYGDLEIEVFFNFGGKQIDAIVKRGDDFYLMQDLQDISENTFREALESFDPMDAI